MCNPSFLLLFCCILTLMEWTHQELRRFYEQIKRGRWSVTERRNFLKKERIRNKLESSRRTPEQRAHKRDLINRNRRQIRIQAIQHYGGKCVCCGEKNLFFLSFDHIDGGGTQHRKKSPLARNSLGKWLRINNYPSNYQILCHNCNMGTHLNKGICPHKV